MKSKSLFHNIITLLLGVGSAKILALLATPILTRLYNPEQFGIYSIVYSATLILTPLVSLRYTAAIPLPKRDATARYLVYSSILLCILMSTLFYIVLLVLGNRVALYLSLPDSHFVKLIVFLSILTGGLYEILSTWAIRKKYFKDLAISNFQQGLVGSVMKIGLSSVAPSSGLLIGQLLSQVSGCYKISKRMISDLSKTVSRFKTSRAIKVSIHYLDFPRFRLPSQFFLVFSMQAPVLFIAYMFDKHTAGTLSLSLTLLAAPIAIIGNSVGQAYYSKVADLGKRNPAEILTITKSIALKLLFLSLPPSLLLMYFGPWLFAVFFGEDWRDSGYFAQSLSIYLLAQFVANPLMNVLSVFNKQGIFLRINFFRAVFTALVFFVAGYLNLGAQKTILLYSVFLAGHYIISIMTIIYIIKKETLIASYLNRRVTK